MTRTHRFFEKHGGRTIFLAAIGAHRAHLSTAVRGRVSQMPYGYFIRWNVIGGITWAVVFYAAGLLFR